MTLKKEQIKNIAIIVLAVVIIALAYYIVYGSPNNLSGNEVAKKVISYLNEKVLNGQAQATLSGKVVSESGLYKINIKVDSDEFPSYASKDGKLLFPQVIEIEPVSSTSSSSASTSQNNSQNPSAGTTTLGNFTVTTDEVCLENDKPIVYFFGSNTCPHCQWEHPVVEKVAKQFEGLISFHNNYDNEKDRDIFQKYSPDGYIPNLVIGCKYFRVGTSEPETDQGALQATDNFTALICKITSNNPEAVCSKVKTLVDSIAE
ncbi:MAG: thioredoxin family protein [Candidatus Pacebacteria bacterium]|nr:thioredoxin family protein [Candidatus Paceibacterota bacterium]